MAFHLIQPAYAQEAGAAAPSALGGMVQFAPYLLMFLVFYVLVIRPRQQQEKQAKRALAAVKRGDRVVTGGGMLATVQKANDTELEIEIAPNVRVTVLRDTIRSVPQQIA